MSIMKSTTIKLKMLIWLVAFSTFIIILLFESQLILSGFLYEKYQIKDMDKIANQISNTNINKLDKLLSSIVYNHNVCIEFVGNDGSKVLYNDDSTGCLLGKNRKELANYKTELIEQNKDMGAVKLKNPDYESEALLYGVKVDSGYVYVFTMLSVVNRNSTMIDGQLFYIALIIVVLSVVISLFLSHKFSEPLVNITEKSKQVAKGNYNVVFEKNGIKEIDELAETLNYLESEVSKTDQYRRDLMANVSHDMKTPLTMIKAYAEMSRDLHSNNKIKREENMNIIIDEVDRLSILVDDILTLSKVQSNIEKLNIEKFDLIELISEIIKRYSIFQVTENYNFNFIYKENSIMINADKKMIEQVIYNLINNAINYTGDDKVVTIKISLADNILVEIIDTGKGINKSELPYIWDKYYKNKKKHKRNLIGTGLGLSIVKNILKLHEYEYGVKSRKNKGSTFYFIIPKNKKEL